jgi:hypothetical protein
LKAHLNKPVLAALGSPRPFPPRRIAGRHDHSSLHLAELCIPVAILAAASVYELVVMRRRARW